MGALPILGGFLYAAGWLWTVGIAFKESPAWGIGSFLVPVVWLFYLFSRLRKTWPCLVLSVAGVVIFFSTGGTIPI